MEAVNDILRNFTMQSQHGDVSVPVTDLQFDSRKVTEGSCFVATRGTITDGHLYINKAIEKGANQMTVATKQNEAITEQIKYKKLELENLQLLSKTQLSANQISKADRTAINVSRVTDELNALYHAQSNTKDTSLLSQYDSKITLFIAVSIEVVSFVMALTLHSLNALKTSVKIPRLLRTRFGFEVST